MLSTFLAAVVAVGLSYAFPVTIPLADAATNSAPAGLGEVFKTLLSNMVQNPVSAIMGGNYVGILTWAVVFGLAVRTLASDTTKNVLSDIFRRCVKGCRLGNSARALRHYGTCVLVCKRIRS